MPVAAVLAVWLRYLGDLTDLRTGDKTAADLDYVPMPDSVKAIIAKAWTDNVKDASGKPVAFK